MRRSSEANVLCYLGNGLVRCLQERKSALQPAEHDVPMRRHSCLLAERSVSTTLIQPVLQFRLDSLRF